MIFKKQFFLMLVIACMVASGTSLANLLSNPSFETGTTMPDGWNTWGSGTFDWISSDPHTGSMSIRLGDTGLALMYQRVSGTPDQSYTCTTWAKLSSGSGNAELKIEFHNASETKISEAKNSFTATGTWTQYEVSGIAPPNTAYATATIVGLTGSLVNFDDVSLDLTSITPDEVVFDVSNTSHTFDGFGTQVWAYSYNPYNASHNASRQQAMDELNIKYIRIENYWDNATWTEMQNLRAVTDALGIDWMYMIWAANACSTGSTLDSTTEVNCFATHWANDIVAPLYSNGIPVEYVELMNEPDSAGVWSTGITGYWYNELIPAVRSELDSAGFSNVGIIGLGLSNISFTDFPNYMADVSTTNAALMSAWSTHTWGDDLSCDSDDGALCIETSWNDIFEPTVDAKNPNIPKWVTEYSTGQKTFHGITYPGADNFGTWNESLVFPYYSVTNSMSFAVRTFENSIALINSGAETAFVWQIIDEWTEVDNKSKSWGFVDLWGNHKPGYGAMKLLCSRLLPGATVIDPPDQSLNNLYAGTYMVGGNIVVAIVNDKSIELSSTVTLQNAGSSLGVLEAVSFEQTYWGDVATGDPDVGQQFTESITLVDEGGGTYSFDVTLPTDSAMVVILGSASSYCGDGTCDPGEDQCNCPDDCGTPPATETNCTDGIDEDCDGGEDCNDPTGDCDSDPACQSGPCNNDGTCDAGEDCNNCGNDCISKTNGNPNSQYCCGDGTCEGAEDSSNCAVDCGSGPVCGDGTCDPGEDNSNCPADCPPSACNNNSICEPGEDCLNCANDCDGVTGGRPSNRYCCGNGDPEPPEGDGTICDGNY